MNIPKWLEEQIELHNSYKCECDEEADSMCLAGRFDGGSMSDEEIEELLTEG